MRRSILGRAAMLLPVMLISMVIFANAAFASLPTPIMHESVYNENGRLVVTGSAFTRRISLAAALDDIFRYGHIHLFADSDCNTELTAPLGNTSAVQENVNRYIEPARISIWSEHALT